MAAGGGNTTVTIQATPSCSWTATSNVPWLAVVGVGAGAGNGAVTIGASANTGTTRTGTATIAGQTFTVTQSGSCLATLNPASASIGSSAGNGPSVAVIVAAGCAWTASTTDSWITITSGASGSGNGTVAFSVTANTGTSRTGSITIAGQPFSVTQAGSCLASINPTNQSLPAGAGPGAAVAVTVASGCAWTATTAATWITLANPASGTGNGTVNFTVTANTGPQRVDTIAIAGQTHTVTQASGCTFAIAPTSEHLNRNAQTGTTISVTTTAGCTWTATSNDAWITVLTGASGTGNGTVTYSVANNSTGTNRTGTITIAGRTFTVNQDH
jgi:hypothetical protein